MKRTALFLAPLALLVAACSPTTEEPAPTAEPPAEQPADEPDVEDPAEEDPAEADPTAACDPEEPTTPYGDAVATVSMPEGTVVRVVQDVAPHRDEDQSMADVIVYLCGQSLDEGTHREIASDVAVALHDSPVGESVNELIVQSYADPGSGLDLERSLGVDDFQAYTWEPDGPRPLESIWE